MKKILLTLIAAFSSLASHSQWLNQNVPLAYDGYINDIEVVDANVAWGNPWNGTTGAASPYTSDFVRTIDGGITWTVGTVPSGGRIISNIWPIDADICYVATVSLTTGGGEVYKTIDGGITWTASGAAMFQQSTSFADVVYFWDANNGMVMGDPAGPGTAKYEIYTTNDAGVTWTRVPAANLPALTNANEYGITNLFAAAGGNIWFGTTYGDVYKSTDMGQTWTKSATGLPASTGTQRQDINDMAFYDANNGIVLQYDGNAGTYIVLQTIDGGATWTPVTVTGNFYPTEVEGIPGTNLLVSAGSSTGFGFGSSFSNDLGATWNDIDLNVSHTAIDFVNATTGFGGEFIALGGPGGAWKFNGILAVLSCGDTLISVGNSSVNDSIICFNDTLLFTTSGALPPNATSSIESGFAILVSDVDISGNNDPLNISTGNILGGTPAIAPNTTIQLINDGTIFPSGSVYYLTAVVFGNAAGTAGNLITTYTFDPACTITGQSHMVNLTVQGDPLCTVGYENLAENNFSISGIYPVPVKDELNLIINSRQNSVGSVSIYDITGRLIFTSPVAIKSGQNKVSLPMSSYSSGVYSVVIDNGQYTQTTKFVK